MFSNVKIDNGLFLDGKKLNCVKSYKLEQKYEDVVADLTVNMDVQVFDGITKTPSIVAGSIKARKTVWIEIVRLGKFNCRRCTRESCISKRNGYGSKYI